MVPMYRIGQACVQSETLAQFKRINLRTWNYLRFVGLALLLQSPEGKRSIVVVYGEDFVERIFVRVDVDHPPEDDRLEAAIRGVAGFLRGD
jgi:hypothetical protein